MVAFPPLLILAGPTASGKSRLAVEVAERLNGVVINADSMQVYREMRIITARPTSADEDRVPHRLYGILSAKKPCSAGAWREMATREIAIACDLGKLPIVVGGTGLYFKALLGGITEIPKVSPDIRKQVLLHRDRIGSKAFHKELAQVDPEAAGRLPENDTQRLTRAYEVYVATGVPLSEWHKNAPVSEPLKAKVQILVLEPPRKELYATCEQRFDMMLANGALNEVRNLMRLDLDPSLPAMKALGVRELLSHIKGEISLLQATEDAKRATRNYAKRQMTWFRNQNGKIEYLFAQYSERLLKEMLSKIRF